MFIWKTLDDSTVTRGANIPLPSIRGPDRGEQFQRQEHPNNSIASKTPLRKNVLFIHVKMTSSEGLCEMLRPLCLPRKLTNDNKEICGVIHHTCPGPSKELAKSCKQLDTEPYLDDDLQARCDAFGLSKDWSIHQPGTSDWLVKDEP
jgi:hypothetical protein